MNELQEFTLAAFMLIGLVNGFQLALNREFKSFALFALAVVAGGVFGALGWFSLPSLEIGLAVGLTSSGVYKTAQKISGY
jgi:hypothetical protein